MDVALHVALHRLVLVGDEETDPGQVLQQDFLDVLVDAGPLILIGRRDPLLDELVDFRILNTP